MLCSICFLFPIRQPYVPNLFFRSQKSPPTNSSLNAARPLCWAKQSTGSKLKPSELMPPQVLHDEFIQKVRRRITNVPLTKAQSHGISNCGTWIKGHGWKAHQFHIWPSPLGQRICFYQNALLIQSQNREGTGRVGQKQQAAVNPRDKGAITETQRALLS